MTAGQKQLNRPIGNNPQGMPSTYSYHKSNLERKIPRPSLPVVATPASHSPQNVNCSPK